LGAHEAGVAIASVATDAFAGLRILFVDLQAEWCVKWLQSEAFEIVAQLLDARLVTDGRMWIRAAGLWFGRIFAPLAVHVIEALGFEVVRLEVVIGDRPRRRDSTKVADFAEIFLAQTKESRAVEFRVPADVVIRVRMERFAVLVAPFLFRLVF